MKTRFTYIFFISLTLFLASCGGGSSSGGGGTITVNDGVYDGEQTWVLSNPDGSANASGTFGFSMSVFENSVTIIDPVFSAVADIVNGSFVANSGEFVETFDDENCTITVIYDGMIDNGLAQGSITGNYLCGEEEQVSFPLSGNFDAARGVNSSKISLIPEAMRDLDGLGELFESL